MVGKRIYTEEGKPLLLKDGDYGKDLDGLWYCRAPGCRLGCLRNHQVTEHEDGTITVSPSILIDDDRSKWHGFLEKGVWREC
jgi:hypothetical protein